MTIIASHLFKIIYIPGPVQITFYTYLFNVHNKSMRKCCITIVQMGMLRSRGAHLLVQGHTASHSPLEASTLAPEHML